MTSDSCFDHHGSQAWKPAQLLLATPITESQISLRTHSLRIHTLVLDDVSGQFHCRGGGGGGDALRLKAHSLPTGIASELRDALSLATPLSSKPAG